MLRKAWAFLQRIPALVGAGLVVAVAVGAWMRVRMLRDSARRSAFEQMRDEMSGRERAARVHEHDARESAKSANRTATNLRKRQKELTDAGHPNAARILERLNRHADQ